MEGNTSATITDEYLSKYSDVSDIATQIRVLGASYYDTQKLRISTGNRLIASYYTKMGFKPSDKKPDDEKGQEGKTDSIASDLLDEVKVIDDYMKKNNCRLPKAIKSLNSQKRVDNYVAKNDCTEAEAVLALHNHDIENKKAVKSWLKKNKGATTEAAIKELKLEDYSDDITLIRDEADYRMVKSYSLLIDSEDMLIKQLETLVENHPLYDLFFRHVKGCGPKMSYVIIAYLNPYKAKYVSSFYMYAGLDTVQDKTEDGKMIYWTKEEHPRKVAENIGETDENGEPVYTVLEDDSKYVGRVEPCEHGRRKGDIVDVEYIAKDGTVNTKKGITYNPILKTKLVGVLADCLIKAQDPVYANIYYDYKRRLQKNHRYDSYTDGHINNMAKRYMIKQFLRNLWVVWRSYEGLEIAEPFEVAKLGNKPHKFNEYHYNMAKIASKDNKAVINYTGEPNKYSYEVYLNDVFSGSKGKVTK